MKDVPHGEYLSQECLHSLPLNQDSKAVIAALINWIEEHIRDNRPVFAALLHYAVATYNQTTLERLMGIAPELVTEKWDVLNKLLDDMGLEKDANVIDKLFETVT